MAAITFSDLQSVKLKRTPPPKVPVETTSSQNGADVSSNTSGVSVSAFRQRFEQKQTPSTRAHSGTSSSQDGGKPTGEGVISVASAKAKFVQKPPKPAPWKQRNDNQTKDSLRTQRDDNSTVSKGEPPRKELPPFFRIGAAPYKKPKPANLKFMLRKYKDKIVLSNAANNDARTPEEEETEETYDDVQSVLSGNQGHQTEELYECM